MSVRGIILAAAALSLLASPALAQKQYGPGTSDTEIKIGQTIAYSGPASAYGVLGKVEAAYFKWLNDTKGGINGRKITFISRDDGYSPPKAVENVRSLVEGDEVALIFGVLGTPLNMAIRPYLNKAGVPQLFVAAGSSALNDPAHFPWTMGWQPNLRDEAKFYARHLLAHNPKPKVARALPERRFRQGSARRPEGGPRRGRRQDDRQRAEFSVDRSDHRQPDGDPAELRRRRAVPVHLCQAGGAGDLENVRPEMEARDLSASRRGVGRRHLQAGRPRQVGRHHERRLHEGRHRSQMGRRSRRQDLDRVDEGQHARRRPQRQPDRGRLQLSPRRWSRC